jgi:hypothetical protein
MSRMAFLALALGAAASGQGWPPEIVGSFPAPPGTLDVAYEGIELYALADGTPPVIYRLAPNGSLVGSFTVTIPSGARGVSYNNYPNDRMWLSNRLNGYIYVLTMTGSLTGSFVCPVGSPYGLGYSYDNPINGRGLYAACRDENLIVRLDQSSGSLLSSFAGPATAVVAFDDFFAADLNTNYLYWDYYGSWQVLDTLPARPLGVGANVMWETDPVTYLYVLCANGYIYRYFGWTAVEPASLGRVKALYR